MTNSRGAYIVAGSPDPAMRLRTHGLGERRLAGSTLSIRPSQLAHAEPPHKLLFGRDGSGRCRGPAEPMEITHAAARQRGGRVPHPSKTGPAHRDDRGGGDVEQV